MRLLAWIVALATLIYCGFWFVASSGLRTAANAAVEDLRSRGQGNAEDVKVAGFPSRLDLTITAPELSSTDGLITWSAPFVQIFALTYQPNRIIAVWPQEQHITTPLETITLTTADTRASATFGTSLSLPLDHSTLIAKDGKLASDAGWGLGFAEARFATRLAAQPNAHDIGVEILGIDAGPLAPDAGLARIDGTAAFDRPIDRSSGTPRLLSLDLREARLAFGNPALSLNGTLTVSADGYPEGRLTVAADQWRDVLKLATAFGVVRPEIAPTWENMFSNLTANTPNPDRIELPLTFSRGRVAIGPLPLGPVPRLPGY